MSRPMQKPHEILIATALTALLSACGQSTSIDPGAAHAAHQSRAKASAQGVPDAGASIDPDMVSAVNLTGSSTNLFSMKFKIESRPQVTAPLQVRVLMIPAFDAEITHMQVLFQPSEGLQLQSGRSVDLTDLSGGKPVEQQVTVVPQQSGVLSLNATVLVDTASESISRTYAIPLIASDSQT
jgi:hypothetical protein